jgi:hypothetical protein
MLVHNMSHRIKYRIFKNATWLQIELLEKEVGEKFS